MTKLYYAIDLDKSAKCVVVKIDGVLDRLKIKYKKDTINWVEEEIVLEKRKAIIITDPRYTSEKIKYPSDFAPVVYDWFEEGWCKGRHGERWGHPGDLFNYSLVELKRGKYILRRGWLLGQS